MATVLSLAELNAYDPHEGHRRLCPLCGDAKPRDAAHRSLSFDARSGLWKCHRCGEGGRLKEFWSEKSASAPNARSVTRARLREAFALPAAAPRPTADSSLEAASPASEPLSDGLTWQEHWEQTTALAGSEGERYLMRRGIVPQVSLAAGVRFAARWFGPPAVVFPVRDLENTLVAAQGRAVRGQAKLTVGLKRNGVFFAPALKSTTLATDEASPAVFGPLDAALPAVIVVEAPIDALSLATCGFPSLALCGSSGPSWLHVACGLRRVLLATDADAPGDKTAA